MKEAILLAAGMSSRMGSDKALLKIGGQTVVCIVLDKLLTIADRVFIVLGDNLQSVKKHLEDYEKNDEIECIYNENHLQGMFSSARKGFSVVSGKYPIVFQLIDQPFVPIHIYEKLDQSYQGQHIYQPSVLIEERYKAGHPIIFSGEFKKILLADETSDNLREAINKLSDQRAFMLVDEKSILDNINTRKEFDTKLKS